MGGPCGRREIDPDDAYADAHDKRPFRKVNIPTLGWCRNSSYRVAAARRQRRTSTSAKPEPTRNPWPPSGTHF